MHNAHVTRMTRLFAALLGGLLLSGVCGCEQPAQQPPASVNVKTAQTVAEDEPRPVAGYWLAELKSPGGPLPFGLILQDDGQYFAATIINGPEKIKVPELNFSDGELTLRFPHYDSQIVAKPADDGRSLQGTFAKRRGEGKWSRLDFTAKWHAGEPEDRPKIAHEQLWEKYLGRWSVRFSESSEPAVAVFQETESGVPWGTFLTTTGDYRYLSAEVVDPNPPSKHAARAIGDLYLRLSCFDGAHAFLFHGQLNADGAIEGDFWSSETWHEEWIAERDETAELPNGFQQTKWVDSVPLADLVFPDLEGNRVSLADEKFAGKARIIEIFGSWCPNCHDAASYLGELDAKFGPRGLTIMGLAFEHTGDFQRDVAQVQSYIDRHEVTYPVLLAGLSDKALASEAFPALDRIRSYPTTIFLHGNGRVRAVYSGFSGPATGKAHEELRAEFEALIEELLTEE